MSLSSPNLKLQPHKSLQREDTMISNEDEEIDIGVLYAVLRKLGCLFEIDESLMKSLADIVWDSKHESYQAQFLSVALWMCKYGDDNMKLSPLEVLNLISYVELFRQAHTTENVKDDPEHHADNCCTTCTFFICPKRSEIPLLTGVVRSLEAKKLASNRQERFCSMEKNRVLRLWGADDFHYDYTI